MSTFSILLTIHVALAVALFLPSLPPPVRPAEPTAGGGASASPIEPAEHGLLVRFLLVLQSHGTVAIGAGLAATGLGMLALLGPTLLAQPWLLLALVIYATNLALAYFIQRPNLRRLLGIGGSADDPVWRARARRQRYVSYLMAGLTGTIAFLMSTKPALW
ncbi:MAG: hypothetical protein KatS3mg065_0169 [Chloroflexota bacterium]|nr:MAG: hypothetical protein KatS3mg065_0169 [Chloroflexota bacterium]